MTGVTALIRMRIDRLVDMLDPRSWLLVSIAGFVLMLAGTLGYVISPGTAWEVLFVVGVVLLVIGYLMLYIGNRSTTVEAKKADEDEEVNGFFYILDEDYSAPCGDATIEDLTRR